MVELNYRNHYCYYYQYYYLVHEVKPCLHLVNPSRSWGKDVMEEEEAETDWPYLEAAALPLRLLLLVRVYRLM